MATNRIAIRTDTAANWAAANPTLVAGEFGYETDTRALKVGDGTTAYTSLEYLRPNNVVTVASAYTVAANVDTVYVDASGGAVTVTLPALSGNLGRRITVRAADATNDITVERAGSDTIVGLTSVTLSSVGDYWTVEAGPSRWELVDGREVISATVGTNTFTATRTADGKQDIYGEDSRTFSLGANARGGFDTVFTGASFANTDYSYHQIARPVANSDYYGTTYHNTTSTGTTTTSFRVYYYNGATAQDIVEHVWHATGRWYA